MNYMLSIVRGGKIGWPEEGAVGNFEIPDANKGEDTTNTYCVGVKFAGGEDTDPANWQIDHVNYWDSDTYGVGDIEPTQIAPDAFMEFLRRHNTRFEEVLGEFFDRSLHSI